jgi:proteasome lid subunit RPN8/RPN11
VSDRVELDRERESRRLPSDLMNELCRHALDVAPEECCGLLVSGNGLEHARALRITNVMTKMHVADPAAFPRDARHAYYMSEVEYLRALEEAEANAERVAAVYHSHFGQGCYLSQDDLAFASHPLFPFPDADQIVISLLDGKIDEVGIFEPTPSAPSGFSGRRLEATP